ncbi:MAG: DUF3880 domain-containing protein [Butyrivibrio sp.]|nr:DUF3880 domain-containing protein [Butyrivibrio sp.]
MNILFYRYNSICEPDVISVLRRLGHSVDEVTDEMTDKTLTPGQQVRIVQAALMGEVRYDLVFSINFFPVVSEVCNIVRVPYAGWIVDSPVMELYSHSIRNRCNRLFMFDRALYEEFRGENPDGIFYLPLASDTERLDGVIASITDGERERFGAEVSFIGSLYTEKCPYNRFEGRDRYLKGYLDGLIEAQLRVYGYNFLEECLSGEQVEAFKREVPFYAFPEKSEHNDRAAMAHLYLGNKVTEQERLRLLGAVSDNFKLDLYTGSDVSGLPKARHRGLAKTMTEMPKIFKLSKINLNFTSKPIRTGLPQRIWDIMGAGGFVLTNYQSELSEYFEIGRELEAFADESELLYKIDYYLSHEDLRKEIAENGYERVKREHSLELRLSRLLDTAMGNNGAAQ